MSIQLITADDVLYMKDGRPDVIYSLKTPPYGIYIWVGNRLRKLVDESTPAVPITISGGLTVGAKLTATIAAGWQSGGGIWQRDGADIAGATLLEYTTVAAGAHTWKDSKIPYTPPAVTVSAAPVVPSVSAAPVLQPVAIGGQLSFTLGTFVGTPTYKVMRGATVVAASVSNGDAVPPGLAPDDQVFVRLVASSSGQTPAQADSNTVVVSVPDPQMFATSARLGNFSGTQTVVSGQEYQTLAFVYPPMPYAQKAPRFWFTGFGASLTAPYEPALPNSCLYEGVSVEVNGVRTVVKMNGAQAFTLNPDDIIGTDPDDSIVIPANTYFRVIVSTYVPVGQSRPISNTTNANQVNSASLQDGFRVGTTSQAAYLTAGTITAGTGYRGPAPSFITAKGWKDAGYPSVSLVVGMSITKGADDSSGLSTPPDLVSGAIERGLNDNTSSTRMAYANIGLGGSASTNISAAQSPKRMAAINAMGNPFSMWLYNHGTNDGGGPAAIAGAQACFAYLKSIANKPIKALTIPPKVTFADAKIGATTLANQIVVDNSAYRTFVLGGSASDANLAGGADIWAPIEPTPGAGKFAVPGFSTTLAAAYTAASNSLSLTDSPALDSSLFIGVGLTNSTVGASAQVVSTVTGTGPYGVTLRSGTTVPATASGATVAQIPTIDGTHPVRSQHTLALTPFYALKNSGFFV